MPEKFRQYPSNRSGVNVSAGNSLAANIQSNFQRALALHKAGRLSEARSVYLEILRVNPNHFDSLHLSGVIAIQTNQHESGLRLINRAIKINPNVASAHSHRGNALSRLNRLDEALGSYAKALEIEPNSTEVYANRANLLMMMGRMDEALADYDQALKINPDFAEVHNNRGNLLKSLMRLEEALSSYENAINLQSGQDFLFGTYIHTKMLLCDWASLPELLGSLKNKIEAGERATLPFPLLGLSDEPALQRDAAEIYAKSICHEGRCIKTFKKRKAGRRIHVGYYSADFHDHATMYLMAELFENHDSDKFEFTGFSYGPKKNDGMRKRISKSLGRFVDVREKNDREIAQLSRKLAVDIAVDLKGYTENTRPGIFAEGCAPIQVNYLGYPGTMGADFIDYIIADKLVIPPENQSEFKEKVIYLPNSYQVNDSKRTIAERNFTRQELGLPESGFVFCCFNNNYKILPETFDTWVRILKAVDGSVLWLLKGNTTAVGNLRREAEARGLPGSRLVFADRMPLEEHLARHKVAGLFLDTLPYNAHTTASDALWAGLPVLTCMGRSFAGRVAASLLVAIGLHEMVTTSRAQYEAKAIELASNPAILSELKSRLERNKVSSPLFNSDLFARHIEGAFEAIHSRHQAGLSPENIDMA